MALLADAQEVIHHEKGFTIDDWTCPEDLHSYGDDCAAALRHGYHMTTGRGKGLQQGEQQQQKQEQHQWHERQEQKEPDKFRGKRKHQQQHEEHEGQEQEAIHAGTNHGEQQQEQHMRDLNENQEQQTKEEWRGGKSSCKSKGRGRGKGKGRGSGNGRAKGKERGTGTIPKRDVVEGSNSRSDPGDECTPGAASMAYASIAATTAAEGTAVLRRGSRTRTAPDYIKMAVGSESEQGE